MKHFISLYIYALLIISSANVQAQDQSWNLLLEKVVARYIGFQVFETDSFYIVVGTSIDTFGTAEQGFSISKVDKKKGSLLATVHYEEHGVLFDFNRSRNGYLIDDSIIFPQITNTLPALIKLFKVNIRTLKIDILLSMPPPDSTSKYAMFLNDFIHINHKYFIALDYVTGIYDTPSFKVHRFLLFWDSLTNDTKTIALRQDNKIEIKRMASFDKGLLVFCTIVGEKVATGKMLIYYLDLEGNIKWEYQTPALSPIHEVKDIYPLDDREALLASYDSFFDYAKFELYTRWTVTRYDVVNKKIIWSHHWDEPRKPYIWGTAKIIKTKNEGEYFIMANDYITTDSSRNTMGKIIKFDEKGDRLWQKNYYFYNGGVYRNDLNNIIATSDQKYLMVGTVAQDAWLVKIDEDGNILPIYTTSATTIPEIQNTIPEIKIYPNPASHTIIINQGEITDMTYQLTDMSGTVVKSIPLPHAHHHVVWDISDVASGTYVLTMLQGGKVIGSRQQVVIR